jgi:MFS family permease
MAGFVLDSYDVLLYVFVVQTLRTEFHWSAATAGLVSSATLITSALGGIGAGFLSDRIGRRRTLILTILVYSLGSAGSAASTGLATLIFWRCIVGFGLGGEWSAGAVLVAESWPPRHRAKAIALMQSGWALGYMLAAAATAFILPRFGWRILFLTGLLPALLTIWIQRKVEEPPLWTAKPAASPWLDLFRRPHSKRTWLCTALATSMLFAYWGLNTWLPGFLSAPRSQGGAALNVMQTSTWIFTMQFGTFLGYASFGWLADWWGRRPAFLVYVIVAAILAYLWTHARLGRRACRSLAAGLGSIRRFLRNGILLALRNYAGRALSHFHSRLRAGIHLQHRPCRQRARAFRRGSHCRSPRLRRRSRAQLRILRHWRSANLHSSRNPQHRTCVAAKT